MTDPSLTEEQQALVEAVAAALDKSPDDTVLREQIGVAALNVPEEYDGAGATLLESALVLEELGRSLAPIPLLASVVAVEALRDEPDAGELLGRVAAGERVAVVTDPGRVLHADLAQILLIGSEGGFAVLDPADATIRPTPGMDPSLTFAAVEFAPGAAKPVGGDPDRARDALRVGVAALATGCAQRGLEMTVGYTLDRRQFGRQIGSFQALKHRMADMLVLVEMSRSGARAAARGEVSPAAAAAYATDAALKIAAETIQLHGGIAITWEHDAHLVLKRAHALSRLAGPSHVLRAEIFD